MQCNQMTFYFDVSHFYVMFRIYYLVLCSLLVYGCSVLLIENRYDPVRVFSSEAEAIGVPGAISFQSFKEIVAKRYISGHYVFQLGIYELVGELKVNGRELTIEAADGAIFTGSDHHTGGIVLGGEGITLNNLHFIDTSYCVKNSRRVITKNIEINRLVSKKTQDCIILNGRGHRKASDWNIVRFSSSGYYRSAIRLFGKGVNSININSIGIDGLSDASYCWKGGIQIYESAHDIVISNGIIRNNEGECGDKFQQGDGVEIDHKEGAPENIVLRNISFKNNRDADVDVKGRNVLMENLSFYGGSNSRHAIKSWSRNYECVDCYATSNFQKVIETKKSTIHFKCSTLSRVASLTEDSLPFGKTSELKCIPFLLNKGEAT